MLAVVYLIFNQGYGTAGDLASEAIRLGRLLAELMADEPEVYGLLALMLCTTRAGRRASSTVNWSHWPSRTAHAMTERRCSRVAPPSSERSPAPAAGPYVLQAAIASLQAEEEIDWHEVALLYERLEHLTGSPVVTLNRAVAIAEAGMPERALEIVDALELGDYRYLPSTRAELLRRLGRRNEARTAFAHALRLATTDAERQLLARRLAGL